ncbi:MAG: hypothetical protein V3T25_05205, partial [Gemmatimonadota bacterium]
RVALRAELAVVPGMAEGEGCRRGPDRRPAAAVVGPQAERRRARPAAVAPNVVGALGARPGRRRQDPRRPRRRRSRRRTHPRLMSNPRSGPTFSG